MWLPRAGPVRSFDFARAVYRNIESGDNGGQALRHEVARWHDPHTIKSRL